MRCAPHVTSSTIENENPVGVYLDLEATKDEAPLPLSYYEGREHTACSIRPAALSSISLKPTQRVVAYILDARPSRNFTARPAASDIRVLGSHQNRTEAPARLAEKASVCP